MIKKDLIDIEMFPAHLHINILPPFQGQGWGRKLMERFLEGMKGRGVGGVWLGMASDNASAGYFYRKLGFVEVAQGEEEVRRGGERMFVRWL